MLLPFRAPIHIRQLLESFQMHSGQPANESHSYSELGDLCSRYCAYWTEQFSSGGGRIIPLLGDGLSPAMTAAVAGAWLSGHGVLPISVNEPAGRIARLLREAGEERLFLVAPTPAPAALQGKELGLVQMPNPPENAGTFSSPSADSTAYVIFTSGSTGQPKKVTVKHRQLELWLLGSSPQIQPETLGPCILNLFGWSFDAWFEPLLWSLGPGHRVVNSSLEELMKRRQWFGSLQPSSIALTPSQAEQLLSIPGDTVPAGSLKRTIFGGEILHSDLARRWRERFPLTTIENTYGPTETTCTVFFHSVPSGAPLPPAGIPLPIGRPHKGVRAELGNDGCLWISSEQITEGSGKTMAAFGSSSGTSWYNTGDQARADTSGLFTVYGRSDNQVKIGGRRINLEEIEAAFRAGGMETCVMKVVNDGRLAAVIFSPDTKQSLEEALPLARDMLPPGCLPKNFYLSERRPVTASGKTNRMEVAAQLSAGRLKKLVDS